MAVIMFVKLTWPLVSLCELPLALPARCGEARYSYPTGVAANKDAGGLAGVHDFKRQPTHAVPPVLKGVKGDFQEFKHEVLLKPKKLDISDHFIGQGTRAGPFGDPLKQRTVLLREGFTPRGVSGAYQAWNFIDTSLQSEAHCVR